MATPAQITANRANAQRSTGPRSAEGKSVSRFNALKHGIDAETAVLPTEDPDAYQALADSYADTYRPDNVAQRFLLDTLIRADWQKQRLQTLESALICKLLAETPGASLLDVIMSDTPAAKLLARIQRQIATHERAWFRAHRELIRLADSAVDSEEDGFERYINHIAPEQRPVAIHSESPERTQSAAPEAVKTWPPVDEKTGQPLYFVG